MAESNVFEALESNVQSYARSFPAVFDKAIGAEVWDTSGKRYLDFLAGAGSLNYGHNDPVCTKALVAYIERSGITHSLDLHTSSKATFLERFRELILAPREMDYRVQFPGPTGTNAVEAALKLARKVKGRPDVVCFTNAFHGVSLGSLATTGHQHFRDASVLPLIGTTRMPYEGYLGPDVDTLEYLDKTLRDPSSGVDLPAAIIVETVQGEGGLNVASFSWLRRLELICRAHDILLIVDDIQAGCGRTGTFFSFEGSGIRPDMVLLSKSLSGYGLPLAAVLIDPKLDQWLPGEHNGTFRGNNHAFVTASAVLEHYWSSPDFVDGIAWSALVVNNRLEALARRHVTQGAQTVGRGMMQGLSFTQPEISAAVSARAFESGLIIERSGAHDQVLKCMPPLTITQDQLQEGLDILEQSVEHVLTRSAIKSDSSFASIERDPVPAEPSLRQSV